MLPTFIPSTTPIDIRVPPLIKNNRSYYEFMEKFIILTIKIIITIRISRLGANDIKELQANVGDWYFM